MNDINIEDLLGIHTQTMYSSFDIGMESIDMKGDFEKKVLVLLTLKDKTTSTEALLGKMLGACALQQKDYGIICVEPEQDLLQIINHVQPETVLLFGLKLHSTAFDSLKETYKPFRFASIKFLLCDSLAVIEANAQLKSTLWIQGLKPLFNITT